MTRGAEGSLLVCCASKQVIKCDVHYAVKVASGLCSAKASLDIQTDS